MSTRETVDLRSDGVTRPTDDMWEAMRAARLGWAPLGEDPSVERIQARAAELTAKEAALFVPTGTMGNLAALMCYAGQGEQIVAEASSHILWSEEWGYASICGLSARPVPGASGIVAPEAVREAIVERRFNHRPRTAAVCLENTHNASGGTVLSVGETRAVADIARRWDVPVHLDGARVFNAAVALGIPVHALVEPADSVVIVLNKGLSAPAGALLCGSTAFIAAARSNVKRLGGHSIPGAGILAAAGIVALDSMIERLADDHRRARALARGLAGIDGLEVDPDPPATNIVMVRVDAAVCSASDLAARIDPNGVRAYVYSDHTLRFVTHRHIGDGDVERAIEVIRCSIS